MQSHLRNPLAALISLALLCAWNAEARAQCAAIPAGPTGRAFYVDPVRGSMTNDGSSQSPWRTFQEVVEKGLIATQAYRQPYRAGGETAPTGAGPVKPGDTIYLRSGDHGSITLRGVNASFITIAAEAGHKPVIRALKSFGASKWIFRGITFQRDNGGWLIDLLDHNWQGPTDNIVIERNELMSIADASGWTMADWMKRGVSGISSAGGCTTIRNNRLTNVRHGIKVMAPNTLVENNAIDHFADDGIDILAGDISVIGNRITNNHGLNDGNHNDGIQGWTVKGATNRNVVIADNVIVHATQPSLPLPGELQGISIFDGKWQNLTVKNNCVIVNHWHGIALYGVEDSTVENNAVAGTDPRKPPWIMIANMKADQGGSPPRNVVVRDNTAPNFVIAKEAVAVTSQNNRKTGPGIPTVSANECRQR